ncbi:SOS response-associated peptidase [Tumebacillus permanentifrigoris]|uniref:Abasic site processing protein n=1 Tax=Tumebacillus permanentifrigoris TaxID=378543 RepID=A0A316D9U8_9BACL|nr:SOS response-associated peptidase [Tumebacillus permanentifrigoris]PWK13118.1 putative SOS response-associated peptidase YedK [Tumebacillus permanentifrigoris]
MCGRFTLTVPLEELMLRYGVEEIPFDYVPRYNIAPGQPLTAVLAHDGQKRIGQLKWGLVPAWAKDVSIAYKTINAKSETVADKPAFRQSFQRKRCLIPADGFYEWQKSGKSKQPMRILRQDREIFSMAGLYDSWNAPDGTKLHTCTILTTKPNTLVSPIHDRMPVILRREDEELWLDREHFDSERLQSLLTPYPEDEMFAYPVAAMVGNVRNELPDCIVEI